uniref:Cilia- and flagella-associated protein 44 n=1 Tax=Xenopus tropicalis TaxID=8364 RepID=A0A803J8E9_XENTR
MEKDTDPADPQEPRPTVKGGVSMLPEPSVGGEETAGALGAEANAEEQNRDTTTVPPVGNNEQTLESESDVALNMVTDPTTGHSLEEQNPGDDEEMERAMDDAKELEKSIRDEEGTEEVGKTNKQEVEENIPTQEKPPSNAEVEENPPSHERVNRNMAGINGAEGNMAGIDGAEGNMAGIDGAEGNLAGIDGAEGNLAGIDGAEGNLAGIDEAEGNMAGSDGAEGNMAGIDEAEGNLTGSDGAEGNMAGSDGAEGNMAGIDEAEGNLTGRDGAEGNMADSDGAEGNMADSDGAEGNVAGSDGAEQNMADSDGAEGNMADSDGAEGNMADSDGAERNMADSDGAEENMAVNGEAEGNMADSDGAEGNMADSDGAEGNMADRDGAEGNMADSDGAERNMADSDGAEENMAVNGEAEGNMVDTEGIAGNIQVEQKIADDTEVEPHLGAVREVEEKMAAAAELEQNVQLTSHFEETDQEGKQDMEAAERGPEPEAEQEELDQRAEPPADPEQEQGEPIHKIPEDFYYEYESLRSGPYVTPNSGIPSGVLQLLHSFGYDCTKRANLHLLDNQTLLYVAGTTCVILSVKTQEQRYVRSSSGAGIGAVTVHPRKAYFAVAEKGNAPNIIIYGYPSLKPYRILRGGTEEAYAFVDFNVSGTLLASVGSSPDYTLTIWDWRQENIMLRSKAFSQDVFQVTFSAENEEQLTTCGTGHIKFWKMASTFTGLKLQGELGRFGKTGLSDIEGYVELPDGKVISGSEWGNMLLWEGGLIKVELCRKGGRSCHNGPINQFVLDEGELITIGSDGFVRVWDFEMVDTADTVDDSGLLEMEPMNELLVGRNVNLRFMVKATDTEAPLWFAQDANGAIWKLDLSFSNITQDPECLFSFHAGNIKALDASPSTYLMATTSLDRSVRIYDFIGKYPLVEMKFKQGGTSLVWAPRMVNPKGGLFAVGFDDGVVRILEVHSSLGSRIVAGRPGKQEAELNLKQAFKPHRAPVTALTYERNGEILATGSMDRTVFFFTVGDSYEPIGFVRVPGPVRELHWTPPSHEESHLLVLCENGFAVQIPAPSAEKRDPLSTFEIPDVPLKYFRFSSIKSKLQREEEIGRRQKQKEQKLKEREAWIKKQKEQGVELTEDDLQGLAEEEEEEPLPPLYVPKDPSPILCGFYASPGKFWLSLDGYDSGFLYLCEFSDLQDQPEDLTSRRDEPLSVLPVEDTTSNPIYKFHFSSNKQLLFCGMRDGTVRVYPLQANDPLLTSMHGYWALGVHDNQYGRVQSISTSYDNQYLVTCGGDSNIFTFSILSMEEIERDLKGNKAKIPSPRNDTEGVRPVEDIEDPNAYSIEDAKQKRQQDLLVRQAEEQKSQKRHLLAELRREFELLLGRNAALPGHMQLSREEFEMDQRIREEMERQTSEKIRTALRELAWEQEKHSVALRKLQARFRDNVECDTVTVRAISSRHQVPTYRMLVLSDNYPQGKGTLMKRRPTRHDLRVKEGEAAKEPWDVGTAEPSATLGEKELEALMNQQKQKKQWVGRRHGGAQAERMRNIMEKAEKAKSKIAQRKREWAELYRKKPSEDYEDPEDVTAIKRAKENMGDFNLKTSEDYTVPEHLRINAERKRKELAALEGTIHKQKSAMNRRILALRDLKESTIEQIQSLVTNVHHIQSMLDPSNHLPVPPVPTMHPDETPEKRFQYNNKTLSRFRLEQESRARERQAGGANGFGGFGTQTTTVETTTDSTKSTGSTTHSSQPSPTPPPQMPMGETSKLEEEIRRTEEIKNLYLQEHLIQKIHTLVLDFDAELRILRHQKIQLDVEMKMADLRHITLFEELLLLKEFEKREDTLQERVSERIAEKGEMTRRLEDSMQQLDTKKREIGRLQEKEKAIHSAFQASLGENNKLATFLSKVFRKKIKRTKKKEEQAAEDEEDESEEESDEESAWESDEDGSGSEEGVFDDSVCPNNCDPALFESTLQLREKRLDVEEALTEEKKIVDNLKKEYDSLSKKIKALELSLSQAEAELEAFQREKQRKLNELDVVVPLKLHQVDYLVNGEIPGDLSQALVFTNQSLESLQQRIRELQQEKVEKRELYRQAREQHKQLIRDKKEVERKIKVLEERCSQQMLRKFGRIVDLEALQTLSVNTTLEELKIKSSERAQRMDGELAEWEEKVTEAKRNLMEVTREQTRKLQKMNELLTEKKVLESKLDALQTAVGEEFKGPRRAETKERQKLLHLVQMQTEEISNLKEEISLLSKKGGSILPPAQPPISHSRGTVI